MVWACYGTLGWCVLVVAGLRCDWTLMGCGLLIAWRYWWFRFVVCLAGAIALV